MKKSQAYNVIDLFSGAGGMSLGFKLQGDFRTLAAVDNWKPACETIKFNNPEIEVINGDLNDIHVQDQVSGKSVFESLVKFAGCVDIILGGPPCQGMSLAGKRLTNDHRNQLFLSFVEFVNLLPPKVFVM